MNHCFGCTCAALVAARRCSSAWLYCHCKTCTRSSAASSTGCADGAAAVVCGAARLTRRAPGRGCTGVAATAGVPVDAPYKPAAAGASTGWSATVTAVPCASSCTHTRGVGRRAATASVARTPGMAGAARRAAVGAARGATSAVFGAARAVMGTRAVAGVWGGALAGVLLRIAGFFVADALAACFCCR